MPVYMDNPMQPTERPKSFTMTIDANPTPDNGPGTPPAPPSKPCDINEARAQAFRRRVDELVGLGGARAIAERLVLLEVEVYGRERALGIED